MICLTRFHNRLSLVSYVCESNREVSPRHISNVLISDEVVELPTVVFFSERPKTPNLNGSRLKPAAVADSRHQKSPVGDKLSSRRRR